MHFILEQSNKAKIAEKWLKALQDCKVDEEASDDDLGPIIKRIQLAARKTKCLLACANEKMGYDVSAIFPSQYLTQKAIILVISS